MLSEPRRALTEFCSAAPKRVKMILTLVLYVPVRCKRKLYNVGIALKKDYGLIDIASIALTTCVA